MKAKAAAAASGARGARWPQLVVRAGVLGLWACAAASCHDSSLVRDQPLPGAKYLALCDTARALAVERGAVPADVQRDLADIPRPYSPLRAKDVACPLTTATGERIRLRARSVCPQWRRTACVQLVQVEPEQS